MSTETIWSQTLDVLEERGWCQWQLQDDVGRVCFIQAFMIAASRASLASTRRNQLHDHLKYYVLGGSPVSDWNDAPGRTFLDIKTLLVRLHEDEVAARLTTKEKR